MPSSSPTRRTFALLAVIWLAVAATLLAGCQSCRKNPNEVRVGAYLSLSGPDSTFGTDSRDGIKLAVDQANEAGGVHGKKIRMLYEDDKSLPLEASNKVRQLIDRDGAVAILGEVASSRSMAGGLIANSKRVPMVTPSSTAIEVTKGREYVFRVCFTDEQQGHVAARFILEDLKKKKVALLYVAQDNYSSGLAKSFRETFKKMGGQIVVEKAYQKDERNFTTYLRELLSHDPDIIFAPVYYNDMIQIGRQANALGVDGSKFVGGDGWDSADLLAGAGKELQGAHFTNHYAPDVPWENSKAFVEAFRRRYGRPPTSLSAQAYDAASLLFDAMKRAPDLSPTAIRDALEKTKDFSGATGTLTIDENHNANKPIVVVEITGGAFKYRTQKMAK